MIFTFFEAQKDHGIFIFLNFHYRDNYNLNLWMVKDAVEGCLGSRDVFALIYS